MGQSCCGHRISMNRPDKEGLGLCAVCQGINLKEQFKSQAVDVKLGFVDELSNKTDCAFCCAVLRALCREGGGKTPETVVDGERVQCFMKNVRARGGIAVELSIWTQTTQELILETTFRLLAEDAQSIGLHPLDHGLLVNSSQADPELFRTWFSACERDHGAECSSRDWAVQSSDLKVIDVHCQRIMKAPANCRYVALSYVWGQARMLQATKSNSAELEKDGGLSMHHQELPQTIKDAMLLVPKLGERYLWVDSLCIIQDDPDDKHSQISHMHNVYGSALLTIVAAAGGDANAGLPGVRPGSRRISQEVMTVDGLRLTLPLPGLRTVNRSQWNTRGWTYQERILSKRCLMFTNDQVYYKCNRDDWCEDLLGVVEDMDQVRMGPRLAKPEYTLGMHPSNQVNSFIDFAKLLREYTRRRLSYESDILNAFSGIMGILQQSTYRSPFFWGLPETDFDNALLWWRTRGKMRRRICPASTSSTHFPSWSWAGWVGPVELSDEVLQTEVVWYKRGIQGAIRINNACKSKDWEPEQRELADKIHDTITQKSKTQQQLPLLQSWTTSAFFRIVPYQGEEEEQEEEEYMDAEGTDFAILDCQKVCCGKVIIMDEEWSGDEAKCEFILLSRLGRHSRWRPGDDTFDVGKYSSEEWCVFNVMLIKWCEDIAHRVGVGTIHVRAWEMAKPQRKLITLC
ncbi:hypothetical protein O6H91_12G101300 [Diphasiastrum complanatum]|uniref:Uncharacterized protein n=1 Tax=Diphasiastrum complanatum TaxID=34168 RepID=A0ACC2C5E1_DIPCM|nr:hypothetical protein O6H91_12G101300 [Diphasiastrum complanatum]